MPFLFIKSWLLPLAGLLAINLIAMGWRAIPPTNKARTASAEWQSLPEAQMQPDVRSALLAKNYWGEVHKPNTENNGSANSNLAHATQEEISRHIQNQLQGIIYRSEWVLLFAHPAKTNTKESLLPIELKQGDQLPNTVWQIGQIWADRVELLQADQPTMIIPLYPIADTAPEL